MKQTQKSSRRIVSKGRYALEQGKRMGLAVAGFVAMSFGAIIGTLIWASFFLTIPHFKLLFKAHDVLWHLIAIFAYLAMAIYLGFIMVKALRLGFVGIKEAAKNEVVPFTRANADGLPAPDTLVRASSEPIQAQENVLLRAATGQTRGGKAQLLRATAEKQE